MRQTVMYCVIILAGALSFSISKHLTISFTQKDVTLPPQEQQSSVLVPLMDITQTDTVPEVTNTPVVLKTEKKNPCPTPSKSYDDMSYLNVDQDTPLTDMTYIPSDLVQLGSSITTTSICLRKDARDNLVQLIADASKEKLSIKVTSGFRSYDTQKYLLTRDLKSKKIKVSTSVAKPGYSEHQLGVAVDLTSGSIANASASSSFGDTQEAVWLEENAYLYGFIESYPKGKKDITGYIYEPWHYRYVGIDKAKDIHDKKITINEYLDSVDNKK